MRRERRAQADAIGREVSREERMILGEPGAGTERLLPDRAPEPFGERDERPPGLGIVGARPDHERRARRCREQRGELLDGAAVGRPRAHDAARSRALVGRSGLRRPVVHRHDHERGPAPGHRLVHRPRDRAGHVLRAHGLVDPHRVLAREALQLAGEERLGCEMAPVLLAHDDHERRAVDARGGQCADGVAEAGGRVQDRERGLAAPDRPARRHADDRALVQREHEAEVVRQIGQQPDLGRPRVREDRGQAVLAPDVEGRLADRLDSHGAQSTQII